MTELCDTCGGLGYFSDLEDDRYGNPCDECSEKDPMTPYYDEDGITIYHGDCLRIMEEIIEPGSIDVVLTDPPYGTGTGERGDWVSGDFAGIYRNALGPSLPLLYRVMSPTAAIYAFSSWMNLADWIGRCDEFFKLQGLIVWDKGRHSGTFGAYSWQFHWEAIYYGLKGPRPIQNYLPDVQRVSHKADHAMAKPVPLCATILSASATQGDTILDPFLGSGASLLAARSLGLRAIGIEIEEKYCEIAVQRLAQGVLNFEDNVATTN